MDIIIYGLPHLGGHRLDVLDRKIQHAVTSIKKNHPEWYLHGGVNLFFPGEPYRSNLGERILVKISGLTDSALPEIIPKEIALNVGSVVRENIVYPPLPPHNPFVKCVVEWMSFTGVKLETWTSRPAAKD